VHSYYQFSHPQHKHWCCTVCCTGGWTRWHWLLLHCPLCTSSESLPQVGSQLQHCQYTQTVPHLTTPTTLWYLCCLQWRLLTLWLGLVYLWNGMSNAIKLLHTTAVRIHALLMTHPITLFQRFTKAVLRHPTTNILSDWHWQMKGAIVGLCLLFIQSYKNLFQAIYHWKNIKVVLTNFG